MPLYEYRCQACAHDFELLVREHTSFVCPSCGGAELDRQFSVFAVGADGGARREAVPAPCGSCGHPDGPGSCSIN